MIIKNVTVIDGTGGARLPAMDVQEAAQRAGLRYAHAAWGYGAPTEPLPRILQEPSQRVDLARGLPPKEAA
ncbi:hypothetical protein AQJ23_16595 [Streptomyces antibioticus]|nr:hypothetical protein [Streptomyces antibioticus]KUN25492.1 hypothetical protein AQJ23_16595 [Streptomyces antibioticus]